MAHVSKKKVGVKTSTRIKTNLVNALKVHEGVIIESLLTPTESLMLAKRLAIIVMLEKGYSSYQIRDSLNVSVSTIVRFDRMLQAGLFKKIRDQLQGKNRASLLGIFEFIFSLKGDGATKDRVATIKRSLYKS